MPVLYKTALASAVFVMITAASPAQETDCSTRTLPISVRDAQGIPIHGLQPSDFEAKIHGKPAQILSITPDMRPHRVVILLDTSGSMAGESEAPPAWQAATIVALQLAVTRGSKIPLSLVLFGETVNVAVDFSQGSPAVTNRLEEMLKDTGFGKKGIRGRTPLYDAIAKGFRLLENPTSADVLYVITDAGNNLGHEYPHDIERLLAPSGVRIFAVILADTALRNIPTPEEVTGPVDLANLVEDTGGIILGLVRTSPGGAWTIIGQGGRANWQAAMQLFYQSLFENDLLRVQSPPDLRKRQRLQIKLSEESRKKWKNAQLFVPGEIEPCTTAKSAKSH